MNIGVQIFSVTASVLALVLVFLMLRRKSFRERHAVWWLIAGVCAVIASLFPDVPQFFANAIGIADAMNLVFFVSTVLLFLVCVQFSLELTSLEARVRRLAEETALQDERIRLLETAAGADAGDDRRGDDGPRAG